MLHDAHDNHSGHPENSPKDSFWRSRTGLATIGFLVIVGFLLVSEHRAHALGFLPFLLLLACPLLHVFGHGGRGSHRNHTDEN